MITTDGLNHLALPVNDPRRSARFYASLFNMQILAVSPEIAFLQTIGANDLMALSRSTEKVPSSRQSFHFGFIVSPDQFDSALETIDAHSVKTVGGPGVRESGRFVFIEDWDGYVVEIFEFLTAIDG